MGAVSLSTFGVILSELQTSLKSVIPRSVLFPLAFSVAVLAWVSGRVYGWEAVDRLWSGASEFEKALIAATVLTGLLVIAYLLDAMQGIVSRFFLGVWPAALGPLTQRSQGAGRELLIAEKAAGKSITDVWKILYSACGLLQGKSWPRPAAPLVKARRDLPRFYLITGDDLRSIPEGAADTSAFVGRLLLQPVVAGETMLLSWTIRVALPGDLQAASFVPVSIARDRMPKAVGVGTYVKLYARSRFAIGPVGRRPYLVVDVADPGAPSGDGPDRPLTLTLAVPRSKVAAVVKQARSTKIFPVLEPVAIPAQAMPQEPTSLQTTSDLSIDPLPGTFDGEVRDDIVWLTHLWKQSTFDEQTKERARAIYVRCDRLVDAQNAETSLVNLRRELFAALDTALDDLAHAKDQHHKALRFSSPSKPSGVSITRMGNIMNSVRSYGYEVYGLDLDVILPRLQSVLGEASAARLNAARERVQLLQWTWISVVFTALAAFFISLFGDDYGVALLLWVGALPLAAIIWNRALPGAALGYADQLRLAIDTERGKILASLGVTVPDPITRTEERRVWEDVGQWWEYGTSPGPYTLVGAPQRKGKDK